MFRNKIAPNTTFDKFLLKVKNLSEKEIQEFVAQAKKIGISEEQISQGLRTLNELRNK